jgi:hypothetical protein
MKRIALILTLALIGCGNEHITPGHLKVVEEHCASNGGLTHILEGDYLGKDAWVTFRCNNGAKFKLTWERAK